MTGLRADARLAWLLLLGSPRSERWRLALTGLGAMLGTGLALAATVVAVIGTRYGSGVPRYTNDLLNESGLRPGVIAALLLLVVPVLAFIGQCTRIGALQRERRLAALRLAGATPRQVRRITALETGVVCGLGSLAGLAGFLALRTLAAGVQGHSGNDIPGYSARLTWPTDVPVPWAAAVPVALALPVLAALEARFTLRRAAVDPLGIRLRGRRPRGRSGRVRLALWSLGPLALVGGTALVLAGVSQAGAYGGGVAPYWLAAITLYAFGLLYGSAGLALMTGRLAARSGRPALLIAGERLQADPWAAARAHAALMLTALVGVGFMAMRRLQIDWIREHPAQYASDASFYLGGYDLAGIALLTGLTVTISGLVVGTVESVMTRRRTLAALSATGTPFRVLGRAVLLETALPLVPAIALASGCSLAIVLGTLRLAGDRGPLPLLEPLLTAAALPAAALLATAASLPLLRRTVHPAGLRYE